jgi:methylmalonyl-CoA mutase, C-terminal domain
VSRHKKIKVLIAKPGLDGHDVGGKVVARALIAAGFEVIYTGLRKSPEEIALAARDNEVDVIGLSILSGSHLPLCAQLKSELEKYQLTNKVWVIGGNIPQEDHADLLDMGIEGVFNTGARLDEIVAFIREKTGE